MPVRARRLTLQTFAGEYVGNTLLFPSNTGASTPNASTVDFDTDTTFRTALVIPYQNGGVYLFSSAPYYGWELASRDHNYANAAPPELVWSTPTGATMQLAFQTDLPDTQEWDISCYLGTIKSGADPALENTYTFRYVGAASFLPTGAAQNATFDFTREAEWVVPPGETAFLTIAVRGRGASVVGNSISVYANRTGVAPANGFGAVLPSNAFYRFPRAPAVAPAPPVAVAQRRVDYARPRTETPPLVGDALLRVFAGSRFMADPAEAADDSAIRTATHPRAVTEAAAAVTDAAARVVSFARIGAAVVEPMSDTAIRTTTLTRIPADVGETPADIAIRLVTFGRVVRYQFQPGDDPLLDPSSAIRGVVRDNVGQPYLGGATVILVRADINVAVQTATSSLTSGGYEFPRNSYDTNRYYVVAFAEEHEGAEAPLQAVTERVLTPE